MDAKTPAAALPRDRMSDVIDVRGVSMRYSGADGGVLALKDINFAGAAGEFMAIVGPSGCGKTTLLKILAGLRRERSSLLRLVAPAERHQAEARKRLSPTS